MALSRGLFHMALLALFWGPSAAGAETVPLQTLRCYNDYTSHIACRWADTQDARRLLNVTLYRQVNGRPPQPVSCAVSRNGPMSGCPSPRCVPRRCIIAYRNFIINEVEQFSFQPDRPLGVQLAVMLRQHVQPPPPHHLQLSTAGDSVLLTWSVALGGPRTSWLLQKDLEFEVAYKRLHNSWEDASTLHSNSSGAILGPAHLLPSSTYVARVRTRLAPGSDFSGRPSRWSREVRWDSQPGDEAQPHNLRCLFDGAHTLSCSWEVRSPVTSSVSFGLFYRSSLEAREKECSPLQKEELGLYTRQRCHIPVPDPGTHGQYVVSVRPRREEKFIKSSANIQMARPTLYMTKDGDGYSLRWEVDNKSIRDHTFQVQYRKDAAEWEDSATETLQSAHSMPLPALEPSTTYWARVRVRPSPGAYDGVWSEWSEERSWTTQWALPSWVLPLVLVILTLALVLVLHVCGLYGYRLNRKWKEAIPNPSKSRLLQDWSAGLWLQASPWGFPSGSPPQGPWDSGPPELERVFSAEFGDSEVSPLTIEDPKVVCDPPPGPDITPDTSGLSMEQPPASLPSLPAPCGRPGSRLPSFDFNGPYLGPPHSRSLPDLGGQLAPPQSHEPAPAGFLEYLCLPPGGQVQLVPLAQVMGQDQAVDAECQPSLGAERNLFLEARAGPALLASELGMDAQDLEDGPGALPSRSGDPKDSPGALLSSSGHNKDGPGALPSSSRDPKDGPGALPSSSGDPKDAPGALPSSSGDSEVSVMASSSIPSADLALPLPMGAPAPALGLLSRRNPGLCASPPGRPPGAPAPGKPGFVGYVELPESTGLSPDPLQGCPDILPSNNPTPSTGESQEDVAPLSPHIEGLLVLQQVGNYFSLPALKTEGSSLSPSLSPEVGLLRLTHPSQGVCLSCVEGQA